MNTKNHGMHVIERLEARSVRESDLRDLALLLVDAVDSGAAVSFLQPLSLELAETWWRSQLETGVMMDEAVSRAEKLAAKIGGGAKARR